MRGEHQLLPLRVPLRQFILLVALAAAAGTLPARAAAQVVVRGTVVDAGTGGPLSAVLIEVEGADRRVVSDSAGRYLLLRVPAGPAVLRAERLGYATTRVNITVPAGGVLVQEIRLAVSALRVPGLIVTADPVGRARGELGTASVIEREAIRHQVATSLAGVLELVPGVVLRPPGLDGVQQFALRSVPTSNVAGGSSAADLASAGTLIVLDGVPLSNNANLQGLGPRGELALQSAAGGGIDLRRIPAALIDRIEVIRGVPSVRYGDLTQGTVVVETRAGVSAPDVSLRLDRQTTEFSGLAGMRVSARHTGTLLVNGARTVLAPGARDDEAYRVAGQLSHRFVAGEERDGGRLLTVDTRIDAFQVFQDSPENPEVLPGAASRVRDSGLRLAQRARVLPARWPELEFALSVDRQQQRAYTQAVRTRPALPFTDRVAEGRAFGRFIAGPYQARVDLDGDPWLVFGRAEALKRMGWGGFDHGIRAGLELRREWNTGPGYQFDMEFPPQVSFNGVQGFDRPRRYDDVPAVATSAFYAEDRLSRALGSGMHLLLQGGLRLDVLHQGTSWFSGSRDAVVQPRVNAEFAPRDWLRLRAGFGRTTKYPTLAQLSPAPQYHDIVNVNWFANDPAERLAVLTTSVLDATNARLRQAVTEKREVGVEAGLGERGAVASLVWFHDQVDGAIAFNREPGFLLRERFQLADSTLGTGRPPELIEPAYATDTIPILLLRPDNALSLRTTGYEFTLALPELRRIHTRLEVQGARIRTRLESDIIDVGTYFDPFQLRPEQPRTPYWTGTVQTGNRTLLNYRLIHQQPSAGLVVTAMVQHTVGERQRNVAGTDSLAYAGYVNRRGELVPVPEPERASAENRDLQLQRRNVLTDVNVVPADWLLSVQVSKTLPLDGRLSFYAFNALDRVGRYPRPGYSARLYPGMRFGLEVTLRPGGGRL